MAKRISHYLTKLDDRSLDVSNTMLRVRVAEVGADAGVPRVSSYLLRLTLCERPIDMGLPKEIITAILGMSVRRVDRSASSQGIDADAYSPIYVSLILFRISNRNTRHYW